jgi:hypothetical protein
MPGDSFVALDGAGITDVQMSEGTRIGRVLLIVALVVGGLVVLPVAFALLGWWQVIFR